MKQSNFFQVILLFLFGAVGIIAVLMFGGFIPGYRSSVGGTNQKVVIWGTLPDAKMQNFFGKFNKQYEDSFYVTYVAKNPLNFEADLLEAMASGQGPDLVFMPQDLLVKHYNKTVSIPYTIITARTFEDTFFDGSEILMTSNGITALPVMVDPLMLYYNKNLFSANNLAFPPSNWSDFLRVQNILTKKTDAGSLLQYGTALGESSNINNAKDILAMLFLQVGNPILSLNTNGLQVVLAENQDKTESSPSASALQFFTQFSDPNKATYTWNRSLPDSQEAFLGGLLGTYFGFGSETAVLTEKNPHLYFDIAMVPQRDPNASKVTYGRILTLAIMSSSNKTAVAAKVAQALVLADSDKVLADLAGQAPARRDLLSGGNKNPKKSVIYQSALISRAWLDPNPVKSRTVFKSMIDAVTMGRISPITAINTGSAELKTLISSNNEE